MHGMLLGIDKWSVQQQKYSQERNVMPFLHYFIIMEMGDSTSPLALNFCRTEATSSHWSGMHMSFFLSFILLNFPFLAQPRQMTFCWLSHSVTNVKAKRTLNSWWALDRVEKSLKAKRCRWLLSKDGEWCHPLATTGTGWNWICKVALVSSLVCR